jgi:phosphomannomutase/phosphoglucomutase
VREAYIEDVCGRVKIGKPLKVVVDAGNGTAGMYAPEILRRAGLDVVELYCDLDVTFPNHFPNPSNLADLADLQKKAVETGADAGVALDGDGDRIGLVDEKGNIIYADRVLIILARHVLARRPGSKIVFDVKCSQALVEDIRAHGGVPIMWKTGHSNIKAKMREERAALAGERSGHIFFAPDWGNPTQPYGPEYYYGFDDAVMAALRTLEHVAATGMSVSEIMGDTPPYITSPEIHVEYPDTKKHAMVATLVQEFKSEYPDVNDVDGARVDFGDGWGLVRSSSNLPELVLVFEAKTQDRLDEIKSVFRRKLETHGVTAPWQGDV